MPAQENALLHCVVAAAAQNQADAKGRDEGAQAEEEVETSVSQTVDFSAVNSGFLDQKRWVFVLKNKRWESKGLDEQFLGYW